MIYLLTNQVNNLYVTGTELSTIPLNDIMYLFEVYSHNTNGYEYFMVDNSSSATSRYDLFKITLSGSGVDEYNGVVDLDEGLYDFNIYETDSPTLDPTDLNLIHSGLFSVSDGESEINYVKSQGGLTYKTM